MPGLHLSPGGLAQDDPFHLRAVLGHISKGTSMFGPAWPVGLAESRGHVAHC
jgi:hypothetical protein